MGGWMGGWWLGVCNWPPLLLALRAQHGHFVRLPHCITSTQQQMHVNSMVQQSLRTGGPQGRRGGTH